MANKKQPTIEDRINNGYIDLTKTGPVSYRELQRLNGSLPQESEANSLLPDNIGVASTLNRAGKVNYTETHIDWGNSMFDSGVANQYEFENYGDYRGERQPWYAKIEAGLAKGAVLAGTTFLNGTVGIAAGVGTAITEGKWSGLWDNDFSRAMDSFNKKAEEVLPNYYTQDELNQPWYTNLFTANFWGDKFIKNIGFTVGAFYSGNLYSKGLGAIMQAVKAGSGATSVVTSGVGSVISAVNEGSIEALDAANEFEKKYKTALDGEFRQRIAAIQAEYEASKGKALQRSVDGSYIDPAYAKYKEAIEKERNNYNQALAKLEEDKAKVGNATLLMNIPILTASNFYQFGKLYSRGYNTARRTADIVGDIGKYEAEGLSKAARAGKVLGGGLYEGKEEVEQQIATDWSQHYYATDVNNFYRSLQDPNAAQETLSWTKSFGETLGRTLGEGSTWEQFFIGGLTGLMGIPRFRGIRNEDGKLQSPIVLERNMFSRWKELKKEADRNQAIANHMNERVNSPEFKNYYQGLIRHNKYQNDMNDATLRDDEFDYKNAEHAQLISDITMFSNAGKLDDLMTLINSAYDTSDENLQSIIDNTTTTINKDGREVKVGPFIDKNGNPMGKEDMIAELTKQKDDILGTIDEYVKTRNKLDKDTEHRFTDEQLDELTWMQTQLGNWAKRAGEMSGQVKDVIGDVIGRLDSQLKASEAIRTHEGAAHADLSENYRRADRLIQSITKAIDNLNFIRSLDNDAMAATLAQNPNILEGLKEQVNKLGNDILSANDKESVIKKLDDLLRIGNASKIYQDKFAEYLFNPKRQEEDHAEADKQNIDKDAEITRAKQVEALNNTANFQEVEALINNGEATLDDLDSSNSDAARSYKKASLFKKKATELINGSDSEHKSELLDMLSRRFNENATYDDLSNESLVTELPLEATTWDDISQETLEHEFNEILKSARDKVNSGNSQKQDVEAKRTGTTRPDNVGKDDVAQPPVDKPFSADDTISKIDKLNIAPEVKTEAKALTSQIFKNIEKLSKSKDPKLIRQTQRSVNALSTMVGNDAIADVIDRVRELSKSDTFNPSSPEEVLGEAETEASKYQPTAVTGTLKAVIPQFDLDAKRDGVLIDFVGDSRNQGYSYVYSKLKEVDPKTGKNAFDYVNEGNIKEGDELEVRYEPATAEHPELLALYHKGTLVNYMNTDEAIEGVKEIKDKAKKAISTSKSIKATVRGVQGEHEVYVEQDLVSTTSLKVGDRFIAPEGIGRGVVTVKAISGNNVIVEYNGQERPLDSIKANGRVQRLVSDAFIFNTVLDRIGLGRGNLAGSIISNQKDSNGLETTLKHTQAEIIRKRARGVLERKGTKQELHDAIVSVNFGTSASANTLHYIYNALDLLHSGEISVDDAFNVIEYFLNTEDDTHKIFVKKYYGEKEASTQAASSNNPTVRVSKIMSGQYGYDKSKAQSVGDLLGTDDATIGVMKNRSMEANTDTFVEPVFDEANSDGKVYILLPNSKGTLSPKKVYIRHLNKTEFDLATQNNPIANDLKKVFNELAGIANLERGFDEALDNVYMDLIELLYIPDSFHINIISGANDISLQIAFADREGKRQNRNILLKRFAKKSLLNIGTGTTQASEPYTASVEEVYNQVLDAFYEANLAFNVDAKKLTGRKGQEYANRLRDSNVLATYLTGKRMQGTWFLLNEKPNTTHTDSAFERAKASQQAKGGTRVQYGGKEYFVRNGIIFDQSGSIVDLGDNAQQVKDLAHINSAYGTSYFGVNQHDGKVLIVDKNGKRGYNRATNKYLSPQEVEELEATLEGRKSKASLSAAAVKSLQDFQKLVLRDDNGNPDTSNGYYMIKEEDGQYHKYQRVHSVIGSNYIGPSRGDAATSRGSLIDEVARQFLIDPTNVTKPEGMSDEAFGALKRGLGKFRDDANRRGLKLVTDRTVVFHKYSDGRRIAGELDVFAYNPSTGEISIFDFKTSKYSTKNSDFSRVENPRYFTRSNKDQYTLQLSAYARLFEDSFGVPVSNLVIIPFQLKYSREKNGGIARINPEDYVPLTYQSGVFEKTDEAPTSQSPTSLRTVKGQYVTMSNGKPEYHQADMQVLFTTKNGQTFYLAKVGDGYKLILPGGRSMTIDSSLVSDEAGRTRNNIMDFIQADNVAAAIQNAMSSTPLDNSPYGNSIELKEEPEKKKDKKVTPEMRKTLAILNNLRNPDGVPDPRQASIDRREKDKKVTSDKPSTSMERSLFSHKKWNELTEDEKSYVALDGLSEEDMQKFWDGSDPMTRESFIPACK